MDEMYHLKAQTDQSEDKEPNGDKNSRYILVAKVRGEHLRRYHHAWYSIL